MKKLYLFFIFVLVAVFAVLTALDYKGVYSAERKLWHLNNQFAKASKDPKIIPDATFGKLINDYKQFIEDYSDSKLVPAAHILIGRIYMIKKDFTKARVKYEEIIELYKDEGDIAVEAVADIGRTYAIEENIVGVINNYKRVMKDYPHTQLGMQAPILLARLHAQRGDRLRTEEAFTMAVAHYKKIIKENPDSRTEFNALRSLGTVYLASNQKRKAVDTFGKVLLKYPERQYLNTQRVTTIVKTINTVSVVDLKDYDLPVSIYEAFISAHPNHPFNGSMTEMIESIKLLKESKLTIGTK